MLTEHQVPRPEHPRPQFYRDSWINLNGIWEFLLDHGKSGKERAFYNTGCFDRQIMVPFCPESKLSGIEYIDFMPCVWYKRSFSIPAEWKVGRILLHFGAVNYSVDVWINGVHVKAHQGGYSSFEVDITNSTKHGENILVVSAENDLSSGTQPSGKQSKRYSSSGCSYTRTTGIWQTVWLEYVPKSYVSKCFFTPDITNGGVHADLMLEGDSCIGEMEVAAYYDHKLMGRTCVQIRQNRNVKFFVLLDEIHLWHCGAPALYDVEIYLRSENGDEDLVQSYFGLREITWDQESIYINGHAVYQRLILDQGFYPDGVITAPSDDDLRLDIVNAMGMGFNGARMHQKIFEQRYIYWADRMGFILWGEHGNWGLNIQKKAALCSFLPEWMEAVQRDYSSPAIICWCPFNETQLNGEPEVLTTVYQVTKNLDSTRPVIDASGWMHTANTDIFDYHDYEGNPQTFREHLTYYTSGKIGEPFPEHLMDFARPFKHRNSPISSGQPVFISEFGGIGWDISDPTSWGYGEIPKTQNEFIERFSGLVKAAIETKGIAGFCYTQLTDVEQEKNGLYTCRRIPKFSTDTIRKIIESPAWNETKYLID